MRSTTPAPDGTTPREQLHRLAALLDEALAESNALHHRIREIRLHVADLSASLEAGHPVAAVRGTAGFFG
jgi:hypothetical protein